MSTTFQQKHAWIAIYFSVAGTWRTRVVCGKVKKTWGPRLDEDGIRDVRDRGEDHKSIAVKISSEPREVLCLQREVRLPLQHLPQGSGFRDEGLGLKSWTPSVASTAHPCHQYQPVLPALR